MNTLRFEASEKLELRQADRDAAIKGWDQDAVEVILDGDLDQCIAEQQGDALVIESHVPLCVNVPRDTHILVGQVSGDLLLRDLDAAVAVGTVYGDLSVGSGAATLSVDEAHGDLAVEQLGGPLSVGQAHGDVHLTQVQAATVARAHGDVYARAVDGELKMGAVSGDVRVWDVAGPLALEEAQGDFRGQDLLGGMNVHAVQGDLLLKTPLTAGLTYSARAQGDVVARFPTEASARFTLEAQGEISARIPRIEEQEAGRVVGQAGEGEAQVVLRAGGDLSVRVHDGQGSYVEGLSVDSLAGQIEAQIAEHLEGIDVGAVVAHEIEKAMRQVEHEIAQAQREAERAAQRAEERVRRAQEKALRKAGRFQAKIAREWGAPHGAGPFAPGRGRGARGPRIAGQGPSAEDQLAVLRMLQEGKISTQEAETLLKALGV